MTFEFEFTIQVTLDSTVMHISTMVGYFSVLCFVCVCVCVLFDLRSLVDGKGKKRCRLRSLRRLVSHTLSLFLKQIRCRYSAKKIQILSAKISKFLVFVTVCALLKPSYVRWCLWSG